jgi:soluble lytic murein transglycosylase-like protein
VRLVRLLLLISCPAISWLGLAQVASAQVYEIGQAGAMQIREGGGAVVWRDAGGPRQAAITAVPIAQVAVTPPMDSATLLARTAARYSLSPALLEALVWQESRWRNEAVSPKGAMGLTQLMPATARALGVDPRDPVANLEGGARYLRLLLDRFGGDVVKALAAYNAGPGRVERAGGVPAIRETRAYVAAIMARLGNYVR